MRFSVMFVTAVCVLFLIIYIIACFQTVKDQVRVCKLWDQQLLIHIVRKNILKLTKSPSLALIRLVLTEIQRFKNVKISKEMYGIQTLCQTASGWPYISFVNFDVSNDTIFLTFVSIYTKLEDFVKLGLHFMTMWINSC